MATSIVVEHDWEGYQQLMNSDGIAAECGRAAERIASAAGDGFHATKAYHPGTRALFRVYGDSDEANIAEADDKVLSRAVSSCRS